jgi:hypothetical protein
MQEKATEWMPGAEKVTVNGTADSLQDALDWKDAQLQSSSDYFRYYKTPLVS